MGHAKPHTTAHVLRLNRSLNTSVGRSSFKSTTWKQKGPGRHHPSLSKKTRKQWQSWKCNVNRLPGVDSHNDFHIASTWWRSERPSLRLAHRVSKHALGPRDCERYSDPGPVIDDFGKVLIHLVTRGQKLKNVPWKICGIWSDMKTRCPCLRLFWFCSNFASAWEFEVYYPDYQFVFFTGNFAGAHHRRCWNSIFIRSSCRSKLGISWCFSCDVSFFLCFSWISHL